MMRNTFFLILAATVLLHFSTKTIAQKSKRFTDRRDGHVYKTTKIGKQVWMASNLSYKGRVGYYSLYENDTCNVAQYGYLYGWKTAKNICPSGWRLPSKHDFETLLEVTQKEDGGSYKALLQKGNSGFRAKFGGWFGGMAHDLPGWENNTNKFYDKGLIAYFWSSTEINYINAWYLNIYKAGESVSLSFSNKGSAHSVRCIKKD